MLPEKTHITTEILELWRNIPLRALEVERIYRRFGTGVDDSIVCYTLFLNHRIICTSLVHSSRRLSVTNLSSQ